MNVAGECREDKEDDAEGNQENCTDDKSNIVEGREDKLNGKQVQLSYTHFLEQNIDITGLYSP